MTGDHFMATLCRLDVFLLFTFLNIISNSRGYTFDEFQMAVRKGQIRASKKRGHYPLNVATLRIRNRVKYINKKFTQSKNGK